VLANFVVEWTETQMPPAAVDEEYWRMYFDGSLMKKGASLGLVFVSSLGVRMRYVVLLSVKTNQQAASGNMRSREAPGTAGGPRSLGQRPEI
jgi:hypothetical protein